MSIAWRYFSEVLVLEIGEHLLGVRLHSRCWGMVSNKVGKIFILLELMLS